MTDTELRKAIIRVAHQNQHLRRYLVPLLRAAGGNPGKDLKKMIEQALKVVRRPWKATLVKASRKENPIGVDNEFWVQIEPPPQQGISFSPTVRLSPTFKFYVTELTKGPKAGRIHFQAVRVFAGKGDRLINPLQLETYKQVAALVENLLSKNAYERLTY